MANATPKPPVNSAAPAALILAAGRGSRLNEYTHDRPKCLLGIGERTIIEHQIQALTLAGVTTIQIVTGCAKAMLMRAAAGSGRRHATGARRSAATAPG